MRKPKKPEANAGLAMDTPIGVLHIVATPRGVAQIDFVSTKRGRGRTSKPTVTDGAKRARGHIATAIRQLREYFSGRRKDFDLPLDLHGTPNQQLVWQGLLEIPYGKTLSYGQLADRIGSPRAARAVGTACGRNPVPVIVPCHRVIGSTGGLHGYGGGLWRKKLLLELEGVRTKDTSGQRALPFAS
jgi:methylated-DNA-[protein]-cysteine S-methyltransferase